MEPAVVRDPRTRVMIAVEAWWEDQTGSLRAVTARMENKSEGGACIRISIPIEVGSRLGIRGRWDQFTGTARYCIPNEGAYLVGIQRDKKKGAVAGQFLSTAAPARTEAKSSTPPVSSAKTQDLRQPPAPVERVVERAPVMQVVDRKVTAPARVRERIETRPRPQEMEFDGPRKSEPQKRPLPEASQEEETGKKRKLMGRNWFGKSNRDTKQDAADLSETRNGDNGNRSLPAAPPPPKISAEPQKREDTAGFPIELLAAEDVYRTSGIRTPRKDYGINKVIEMLRSEHVRDLPKEMKRAAVLMALDAAGIPIEEVLRDAKARQDALDSYEAERKTQIEAEWARKAKENAQILAELESAKLQHMAAINRNLDRIAREKATFGDWVAAKQQESQSIADAVALCLKATTSEPAANSAPALNATNAAAADTAPASPATVSVEKTPR
jgi:hypothetical protein